MLPTSRKSQKVLVNFLNLCGEEQRFVDRSILCDKDELHHESPERGDANRLRNGTVAR